MRGRLDAIWILAYVIAEIQALEMRLEGSIVFPRVKRCMALENRLRSDEFAHGFTDKLGDRGFIPRQFGIDT